MSETAYLLWAVALGALSAASLPLGSAVGLALRPRAVVSATLGAFGAGALIAALSVELVAPTAAAVAHAEHGAEARTAFFALLAGGAVGGILFAVLDRALAERGGFLRKTSTAIAHVTRHRARRRREMLMDLCAVPVLRRLPATQVGLLADDVRRRSYASGECLFSEGEAADGLHFVRRGEVELERGGASVRRIAAGGILGELALVADIPRHVTARAEGPVDTYELRRSDVERWRRACPEFDTGVRELARERLSEIAERDEERGQEERRWGEAAIAALTTGAEVPTPSEMRTLAEEYEGSPLAVWLGLLIDGIPESIVIGAGLLTLVSASLGAGGGVEFSEVVPYTLIAGLFLSNFPEALSSSVGMRSLGWSPGRILGLWFALLVVTALGAGVGYAIGEALSHTALVAVEGLAAGAMLTAIASTMIPEAVHLGGSTRQVGLATLAGFLAAISFKLLE